MSTIPQDYLAVLSIVISVISHRLRSDNLGDAENSAIAFVAIVIIVGVTAWMSSGFTSDIRTDVLLGCSMLLSLSPALKELYDILGYQAQASSPLAPKPPMMPPAQ